MKASLLYPDAAFEPLERFGLVWRWTSAGHAVFPPEVLAQIRPFTSTASRTLSAEALARVPSPVAPSDASFACDQSVPVEEVTKWLMDLSAGSSAWTVLSWSRELAALIPWTVFASRWSDFCYPSSDDVHIWQPGHDWTLAYQHLEVFRYYQHRAPRVV
jgi:hypothetical protein